MKKICYITTIPETIESFFIPQMKYLSANGFDVYVICSQDDCLQSELGDNITYIPINIARGVSLLTLRKSIVELIKVFKRERFDIIQYSTPNAAFCASIAAFITGAEIRNYHMMGLRYLGESGFKQVILKTLEKLTCLLSTHIECVSRSNLELCIQEKLFKRDKVTIVWNGSSGGVKLDRFDYGKRVQWRNEVRTAYSLTDNDFVFGFVGRITKDKGINEILEAFKRLDNSAKLMIIGSQEGMDTLNKELWDYAVNSDNVIIIDSVSDIEKYYAAIDVLLLPSYREGFGMVIAEAAAVGTPAIVSNIPGPIDVIDEGKTAYTVEVKNTDDLYEKMKIFIDNKGLCRSMSENCVEHIKEKFDSDKLNVKILERKIELLNKG